MKESAQIALSYLRSHGAELELPVGDLKDRGVHIHVPAGAVPKDGPSAGVTMTTALASLLSRPAGPHGRGDDRRGLADRAGAADRRRQAEAAGRAPGRASPPSIIPKRNEPDLDDVPAEVLGSLEVHPVADVRQVLELALTPAPNGAAPEVPVAA